MATKPIIADGGIRQHGDIAKSVRFGAAMVMVGSLFAGHEESAAATAEVDGRRYKEYYGSASDFNKGEYKHVEGKRILELSRQQSPRIEEPWDIPRACIPQDRCMSPPSRKSTMALGAAAARRE